MEEKYSPLKTVNTGLLPSSGGLALSLTTIINLFVTLILFLIIQALSLKPGSDSYIYLSYIAPQLAIAAGVFASIKVRKLPFMDTFPVKCSPKYYLIGVMLIFGLLFSLGKISQPISEFFKLIGYNQRSAKDILPNLSGGLVVPALIVIGVLPAVFEESLFRGVILRSCEMGCGTLFTVLLVGMSFSLYHTSPEQTVYQFFAGCVFAFIAVRSGSILPSVVMHFINNALIVIFGACGLLDAAGNLIIPFALDLSLAIAGGICLIGGLVWLILDKKSVPYKRAEAGTVKSFFITASLGLAILVILWISSLVTGFFPQ
ncbi:MAG: CPBP family intramembrane metalloprotease [Clostridiales bacterium]|nr:CPBP family intramembrane metalloprotease [Clostridiales bacterium]